MMYVRFCKVPQDEKSWNFMRNRKEEGVSVFKADDNGMPILENAEQAKSLWARLNRRHYLVTGNVVGYGQDGEPLLQNVRVVRRLRLDRSELEELITTTFERFFKYRLSVKYSDEVNGFGKWFGCLNNECEFVECGDPSYYNNGELKFVQWCNGASYRGKFYTNDLKEPTEQDFSPSVDKAAFVFSRMRNNISHISEFSGLSKSTLYKFKNSRSASSKTIKILSDLVDKHFYADYLKR